MDITLQKIKYFVLYALNPVLILTEEKKHEWYYHLILPAVGWMFFFLQVGIYRNSHFGKILLLSFTGLILGYVTVLLISLLLTFLLTFWKIKLRIDQTISCVALSHTYMTFSTVLGLIYIIFGNISPTSFGIAGLLCTLLPIYAGIRSLGRSNTFIAPILASIAGVLMLAGWQLILYINI